MDDLFIVDLLHAILYLTVLLVTLQIILKYRVFDKTVDFIGMDFNRSFLNLCNFYVVLTTLRIGVHLLIFGAFVTRIKPLCRYSGLNDYPLSRK